MKTQTYIAKGPWVAGQRVTPGAEVELTPAQARYEPVMPKPPRSKPAPAKSKDAGE